MDSATIFGGLIFGALGTGYLIYAKRQRNAAAFIAGAGLCVFTFFVTNVWLMILTGLALLALPFAVKYWTERM